MWHRPTNGPIFSGPSQKAAAAPCSGITYVALRILFLLLGAAGQNRSLAQSAAVYPPPSRASVLLGVTPTACSGLAPGASVTRPLLGIPCLQSPERVGKLERGCPRKGQWSRSASWLALCPGRPLHPLCLIPLPPKTWPRSLHPLEAFLAFAFLSFFCQASL